LIENGDKLYPGNPLRVTKPQKIVVVFRKTKHGVQVASNYTSYSGSFELSYSVSGKKEPFWRRPFVDQPKAYYYLFLVALFLTILALIGLIIYSFIVRPCC